MDFFAAIEKRASVREFRLGEIPREHLMEILEAGRRAPSGHNYQAYEFIAVTDRARLDELRRVQECIGNAGAVVVVVSSESKYSREDAAAAVENMLLAATALGYGSLWVATYLRPRESLVRSVLRIPENLMITAIVAVGHSASPVRQADKKSLCRIVHWNRYGERAA